MILYFADRKMNILGLASTGLPKGLAITEDTKTEEIETGVATFSCRIPFNLETREKVEGYTRAGNYIFRSDGEDNEFYTIIETELDTEAEEVCLYAEDAGLDLLNEVALQWPTDKTGSADREAHSLAWYFDKLLISGTYAGGDTGGGDTGFTLGMNEAADDEPQQLSWGSEATVTERLLDIAEKFGCEIGFRFAIEGMAITHKYVDVYKTRGKAAGVQLRLGSDIDRIVTKTSVANLATALKVTGAADGTGAPVNLEGYSYDDGDFYVVSGSILRSRTAYSKWSRYIWEAEPGTYTGMTGDVIKTFTYDTVSQEELCKQAITELKKVCAPEVNYEVELSRLPANVRIGDWVTVVDGTGEQYLSARVLKLETSVTEDTRTATLGEYLIRDSGISQKVEDLAKQFAQQVAAAQKAADLAQAKADKAEQDLIVAQEEAAAAQAAADEAQAKAEEAAAAAAQAKADAAAANAAVEVAQHSADSAIAKAETAQSTADTASTQAADAKSTADAAKLDAAAAQAEIDALGTELETVSTTMQADYARKTDLTEATASLQTQISQNAAEISSTASKVQTIDETANSAAAQAATAQTTAAAAQAQADQAAADAADAKTAADNAAAAATSAQNEADTAAAAAAAAQTAADMADAKAAQAVADLEAAKQNLTDISAKADATEEEVAAAQQAVAAAQEAAEAAAADAAAAQSAADTAKTDAATAQTTADAAQTAANTAKAAADQAQADADAAQAAVDALAVRMTTAETNITQNAEKIELSATKTEVVEALGGYYTKEESDAAIQLKADSITQSVSSTYATKSDVDNLEIGSRNYIRNSKTLTYDDYSFVSRGNDTTAYVGSAVVGTATASGTVITAAQLNAIGSNNANAAVAIDSVKTEMGI